MASLADAPDLVGFFSYSREDDEGSGGKLSKLRERIQEELRLQLGRSWRDFRLWQDKAAIAHGELWEDTIKKGISESVFFIPIITPSAVRSSHCKFEFASFLAREKELDRNNLIFPILYVPVPALRDEDLWRQDPLLSIIGSRQYEKWQNLRHLDASSTEVAQQVEKFCENICRALQQPWLSPEERREAEARRLAEAERRRQQEAEMKQRADEEERRKKAEAEKEERRREEKLQEDDERRQKLQDEARRLAEEERRRQEAEVKRRADEAESQRRAEAEARQRADEERRRQEAEAKRAKEEEAQKQARAETRRRTDEKRKREAEEERKRAESQAELIEGQARRKAIEEAEVSRKQEKEPRERPSGQPISQQGYFTFAAIWQNHKDLCTAAILQAMGTGAALIATWINIESIFISGPALSLIGFLLASVSRRQSFKSGVAIGLSPLILSLFCLGLILGFQWGPQEAHTPILVIVLLYSVAFAVMVWFLLREIQSSLNR